MALFVLTLCPFDVSVGVGAFVIGLSQISSFFSFCRASQLGKVVMNEIKRDIHLARTLFYQENVMYLFVHFSV